MKLAPEGDGVFSGDRGVALNWFVNYLANRFQHVTLNNQIIAMSLITFGVPQGYISGPLLFTLFIKDILLIHVKLQEFIMFADDTNLFLKHNNLNDPFDTIKIELAKISVWLKLNKLSLNIKNQLHHFSQPKQKKLYFPN